MELFRAVLLFHSMGWKNPNALGQTIRVSIRQTVSKLTLRQQQRHLIACHG